MPYSKNEWARYLVVACLILLYTLPIFYVYSKRNFVETRARSPITTTLCIFFIMLDSIFNTWIFSIKTDNRERAQLKCLLGVWVTMLLMIPILLSMYIRIYRVKRVFELYEKFLARVAVRSSSVFSTLGMMSSMTAYKLQINDKNQLPSTDNQVVGSLDFNKNGNLLDQHRQTIPAKSSQNSELTDS